MSEIITTADEYAHGTIPNSADVLVEIRLTADEFQALQAIAREPAQRRTPEAQGAVFIAEAVGSWGKKTTGTTSTNPSRNGRAPAKSANGGKV